MKCIQSYTRLVYSRVSMELDAKFAIFSVTLFSTDQRGSTNPRIFPSRSEYFFNFCLNQRTKVSMLLYKRGTERGWFQSPQRDFSSRKKKKKKIAVCIYNALYSTQTFVLQTFKSRIFGIVRISLRDGVQVFSYITNFVWKDAGMTPNRTTNNRMDVNDGKEWRSLIIYKFIDASSAASRKVKLIHGLKIGNCEPISSFCNDNFQIKPSGGLALNKYNNWIQLDRYRPTFPLEKFSFFFSSPGISFGRGIHLFV